MALLPLCSESSPKLTPSLLGYFLLLLVTPVATTAEPLYQKCSSGTNYTANSAFQTNVNLLLSSLPANGYATGFFNTTVGNMPDRVYGLVLCRGDVSAGGCRTCLDTAAQDVLVTCPYRRSAVIWYDTCMLRYSNKLFFSVPDDSLKVYWWPFDMNVTEVTQFNRQRDQMMSGLARYAAYNRSARMFATGEADYSDPATPKIYGLVQCTRDQSADDCNTCLRGILGEIPSHFPRSKGARILKATCNFRYELFPFFDSPVMVSVPLQTNGTPPNLALQPPMAAPAPQGKKKKKRATGILLAIAISLGVALAVMSALGVCFRRKKSRGMKFYMTDSLEINTMESLLFDLCTLRAATGNFSDLNKVGQGGFGSVYKGILPDGREIAVKRLLASSGQGTEELKNEVALLAKLQHRSLVRLLGACLEGEEKLLVYEYVPNGSLDKFLFDPARSTHLDWERRRVIIGRIARGLEYLHEDSQLKTIHRDLKASNILLDADMNPKISDFGLARLFRADQTQASTSRVVGTFGYIAPEYAMRGHFSNKSDVFSFGVLVLEIVTGRRNSDYTGPGSSFDLPSCVWAHWNNGTVLEIVDPCLDAQYERTALMRCVHIALLCVQEAPADRPTMTSVVVMLSSCSVSLKVPSRPAFFGGYSQPDPDVRERNLDSSTGPMHDKSASKPVLYSPNEVSITEVEPR